MSQIDYVDAIRLSLASPEQIKSWSHGEVTKAETINYRTLKSERDGLFCERIFGPNKDYECSCGKYKKARYKGVVCDKCEVEVAHSSVRRERMGHIELAAPVVHIWFSKLVPSRLGLILDLSPSNLEGVIYFSRYIVISVDEEAKQQRIQQMEQEVAHMITGLEEYVNGEAEKLRSKAESGDEDAIKEVNQLRARFVKKQTELGDNLKQSKGEIEKLKPLSLLRGEEYQEFKNKYGDIFEAGTGAEAILEILKTIDIEKLHQTLLEKMRAASGQSLEKISKRLQLVEAFKLSGSKPEWMILTVLPVLPPALRPIVPLDGGRFVISDLNDLYRRVINRNNRLRRLMKLGAPAIIINNEKRMLQEAVDALIDNGRRGRVITAGNNHPLKSLSAMLKGKQGRFRQNLLGKRVDYSGRSVIVVGPDLKLHQCGLPRNMALELFKPFVIHKLLERGYANNLKSAKRHVERARPEIWDLLTEVVKDRPVLLNRAPTLHRLSIQAFEPVLIDGGAIQLHPLVCTAFNADFDGDQMAVHLPLSQAAIREARQQMLSVHNMLLPSSGEPAVTPSLDMVLGCYYLTLLKPGAKGEGRFFSNFEDAKMAYELGAIDLGAEITVRQSSGERIKTTIGRILFNEALPSQLQFYNAAIDKAALRSLTAECIRLLGEGAAATLDNLKTLGFDYATKSGISVAMNDIEEPPNKSELLADADRQVSLIEDQLNRGLITEEERYESVIQVWTEITDKITDSISQSLDPHGGIYMMATSGAKGNISQLTQMAGMRGLMIDPSGGIIDLPIKSSFRDGLSPMEYFISTHGARKGLADTALRTSDAGYLTRRLIDVAQDITVLERDCGTTGGIWISGETEHGPLPPFRERLIGYLSAIKIIDPTTQETILDRNEEIDEEKATRIIEAGIAQVYVRSPLTCHTRFGVCQYCYGKDLAKSHLVKLGTAVGIIAAQSIGEPGTQLTLRTFHTGGVAGVDITSGLPRVEELFEAHTPKGSALLAEIDGTVNISHNEREKIVRVTNSESYLDEYLLPPGTKPAVTNEQLVDAGTPLAITDQSPNTGDLQSGTDDYTPATIEQLPVVARISGQAIINDSHVYIKHEEREDREYAVPHGTPLLVDSGDMVRAGERLTEGVIDPDDVLRIMGKEVVEHYLIDEIQKVYHSQGVKIHDKHIATIIRQMLGKVSIISPGDTRFLPGELVERFEYEDINAMVLAEGGEPATAQANLLGITRAGLSKDSWLAAASFQETSRVLVNAAIRGKIDKLRGLNENVILGKLIPSQLSEAEESVQELEAEEDRKEEEDKSVVASSETNDQ